MSMGVNHKYGFFVKLSDLLSNLGNGLEVKDIEHFFQSAVVKCVVANNMDEYDSLRSKNFSLSENWILEVEDYFKEIEKEYYDSDWTLCGEILDFFLNEFGFPYKREIRMDGWPDPTFIDSLWSWETGCDLIGDYSNEVQKNMLFAVLSEEMLYEKRLTPVGRSLSQSLQVDIRIEHRILLSY